MSSFLKNMWDNKEEVVGGLFDMFSEENALNSVDKRVSNLKNLGVPEGLLYGRETTTEPNLLKSTGNAIYNLPSQVPRLAKDVISAVYNPIDTATGLFNVAQGAMTNTADVINSAILPDTLFDKLEGIKDKAQTESMKANEEAMELAGQSLLDPQVRREIAQNYGLEGLIGYASLPKNLAKLSPKATQVLERVVDNTAPFGNTIGTQMFGTRKSSTWNKEKFGSQIEAKMKAQRMFNEMGVNKESVAKVFKETNYFITPRGDLVHHINDVNMEFTPKVIDELNDLPKDVELGEMLGTYKAEDVFTHAELFENYPELKDYNITLLAGLTTKNGRPSQVGRDENNKFVPTGLEGSISHNNREIEIFVDQSKGLTAAHKDIIVHEVQHAVQNADNLATGGNSSVAHMVGLKKVLELENDKINEQLKDPTLSPQQINAHNKRKENIAVGLESLDTATIDPMTVSPKDANTLRNVRNNVYLALEGEWLARLTQTEKMIYNQIQDAVDAEGSGKTVGDFLLNENIEVDPFLFADDATGSEKLLQSYPPEQVNGIINKLYENGLISAPNIPQLKRWVSGANESRRLLSDAVRYEGMSPTEAQNLAAGYGRDRIMDDNLRRALENKEIIPDYVKVGGLLEEPQVSLRDYAGRSVIFPMADTSATGQTTMEVAGKELARGSKDEGGQAFALDNPDLAWANDEKAMSALMNNLTEAQKLSKDPPLIMPWQMGGGAINFSVQMSDTMIQAARANLTDAEMKVIDDKVRAQEYLKHYKDADGNKIKPSEKVKLNPNFKGIKNVDLTKLTGMQRIALIGHLDTNAKSKIGSMLEHQLANADPTQLFTDPFTLHNIMEADLSRGILDSPHRTYNKAVGGSFQGRIKEPVSLLDLINAQTKAGVPITTETIKTNIAPQNKSLMGQKLNTLLSEETIDKAIKLGEERLKRKKKNKK